MLIVIGIIIVMVGAGLFLYVQRPEFGHAPTGQRLARIQASPHYTGGKFQNLEPVNNVVEGNRFEVMMKFLFGPKENIVPNIALPTVKTDLKSLNVQEDIVVWLGHSSFYMQLGGQRILVDPVFSPYASPLPFINKAFVGSNVYTAEDMPDIDVLVISHDHWDHLDYPTVMGLKSKIKEVVCPLGVGEYFEEWGFSSAQLHEEDWFTEIPFSNGLRISVLPAQHFSGRFLQENQTEWASFAFVTAKRRVFYSGDGGYGSHFKRIGDIFGGFDLAILENGQYNENWARIHMMPAETAQAAIDLQAKTVLPVHNSKFALSRHAWHAPLQHLTEDSQSKGVNLLTPKIGELAHISETAKRFSNWWEEVE